MSCPVAQPLSFPVGGSVATLWGHFCIAGIFFRVVAPGSAVVLQRSRKGCGGEYKLCCLDTHRQLDFKRESPESEDRTSAKSSGQLQCLARNELVAKVNK